MTQLCRYIYCTWGTWAPLAGVTPFHLCRATKGSPQHCIAEVNDHLTTPVSLRPATTGGSATTGGGPSCCVHCHRFLWPQEIWSAILSPGFPGSSLGSSPIDFLSSFRLSGIPMDSNFLRISILIARWLSRIFSDKASWNRVGLNNFNWIPCGLTLLVN